MPREPRIRRSPRVAGSENSMRLGGRADSPPTDAPAQCAVVDIGRASYYRWEIEPGCWHALRRDRGFLKHIAFTVRPVPQDRVWQALELLGMHDPHNAAWRPGEAAEARTIFDEFARRAA